MIAAIFPGQGAQAVGMGRGWIERFPALSGWRKTAERVMGFDLLRVCLDGPVEKLDRTDVSQPALFLTSVLALEGIRRSHPSLRFSLAAGLSLGEYTALYAAGVWDFESGLTAVRERGRLMDQAGRQIPGGMLSLLGADEALAQKVCEASQTQVANVNAPDQVVIAGPAAALEKAQAIARELGVRKTIALRVSGGFHSRCMEPARQALEEVLRSVSMADPVFPVLSNVTGRPYESKDQIAPLLTRQLVSTTRWADCMKTAVSMGIRQFVEIGSGTVLKGLMKRICPDVPVISIQTPDELPLLESLACA